MLQLHSVKSDFFKFRVRPNIDSSFTSFNSTHRISPFFPFHSPIHDHSRTPCWANQLSFGSLPFGVSNGTSAVLNKMFRGFFQCLSASTRIMPRFCRERYIIEQSSYKKHSIIEQSAYKSNTFIEHSSYKNTTLLNSQPTKTIHYWTIILKKQYITEQSSYKNTALLNSHPTKNTTLLNNHLTKKHSIEQSRSEWPQTNALDLAANENRIITEWCMLIRPCTWEPHRKAMWGSEGTYPPILLGITWTRLVYFLAFYFLFN